MATLHLSGRPAADEHHEYYGRYIDRVQEDDVLAVLDSQLKNTLTLFRGFDDALGDRRYGADKWSVKEVVGHITDTERVMTYRALRIARGDATPLPGFEQDDWMRDAPFAGYRMAEIAEEWGHVRQASVDLFRHLTPEAWSRRGTASGNPVSVRALAYIVTGHVRHHLAILGERYGVAGA
jgi:hypothetical protein